MMSKMGNTETLDIVSVPVKKRKQKSSGPWRMCIAEGCDERFLQRINDCPKCKTVWAKPAALHKSRKNKKIQYKRQKELYEAAVQQGLLKVGKKPIDSDDEPTDNDVEEIDGIETTSKKLKHSFGELYDNYEFQVKTLSRSNDHLIQEKLELEKEKEALKVKYASEKLEMEKEHTYALNNWMEKYEQMKLTYEKQISASKATIENNMKNGTSCFRVAMDVNEKLKNAYKDYASKYVATATDFSKVVTEILNEGKKKHTDVIQNQQK